ncbi:hypothetical protein FA15DRAFT_600514 [Coprinopsis marcescibilis]|uniref:L domain-like protein n=1 Tax=Coprinopsis marcescibilis TaxID=230819 RepID=A0A5C3KVP1_COPMA|nr:hypothetical protein FA15DRAFT_600514 [Coprinopsis marcescibilis]
MQRPAWQTEELQEEWVDLEPEDSHDGDITYGTQSISLTAPLASHIHTNSEGDGTATPSVGGTSRILGTVLVREDMPNVSIMPKTPGRNKKFGKDIFTPLQLERMFDPPTPPISLAKDQQNSMQTLSPPQSAILKATGDEEEDETEDEILETDIPNMQSFNGRRASLACQFTFAVPKNAGSQGEEQSPGYYPQAQSTPLPPGNNGLSAPPTDSRLRLFQFQYDTYTREHLSAMVDSIAINTPSGTGTGTTVSPQGGFGQNLSRVTERTADTSHLRSAKRIKLSPIVDYYGEGAGAGAVIARPKLTGKDYVGESRFLMERIKQARDFSTISTVTSSKASPASQSDISIVERAPISKPEFTRRVSPYLSVPETSDSKEGSSTSNTLASKSNSYTSYHYRQNAETLMDQIKKDMKAKKRIFSGDTDTSIGTATADEQTQHNRSIASTAPSHRQRSHPTEKENQHPGSQGYRRPSGSKSNHSRTKSSPRKPPARPTQEELNESFSRISLHDNQQPPFTRANIERVQAAAPSTLAPPSYPSVRINGNEDLNRFVSSSTASGTTLTASSVPSFVKHAGPAHLRTIAPADLPSLPERLGDMLFDKVMMKWVKNTVQATRDPDKSGVTVAELSDDPFGDFESLHDDSRLSPTGPEAEDVPGAVLAEMAAIEERSEADDEEESELTSFSTDASMHVVDIMTGVDSAGYNDDDETTDSDADDELEGTVTGQPVAVVDYESGDEDASPTHATGLPVQTLSAHPPHDPVTQLSTPNKRNRSTPLSTPILRSALKSHSVTPTSVLKGSYRTPGNVSYRHRRSVSFTDGKREGPIQGLDSSVSSNGTCAVGDAAPQPSARSKRIADMMDALADSDFDDEDSPSKSSSLGRPEELRPLQARQAGASTEASRREPSRRVFSRSQTHRPSPGQSLNKANATFLTECSFGVAHDRLVEVITDVQPFEPYWEELGAIDLSDKKLESVARLKEFLPRLDSLSLQVGNSNQLSWLSGVPASVRTLSAAHNNLTGLTSYNHLRNIENLDISHNEVDSLRQLECLRHLRELKADGNKITSADGLQRMDGLVKLSLQGNAMESIDLSQFRWFVPSPLYLISLDGNCLRKIDFGNGMPRLRILRVSNNKLSELGVGALPNLRTLYADSNSLSSLIKVDRLTKLENLSLRNQSGRKL